MWGVFHFWNFCKVADLGEMVGKFPDATIPISTHYGKALLTVVIPILIDTIRL